jgi:hypothetical protein
VHNIQDLEVVVIILVDIILVDIILVDIILKVDIIKVVVILKVDIIKVVVILKVVMNLALDYLMLEEEEEYNLGKEHCLLEVDSLDSSLG